MSVAVKEEPKIQIIRFGTVAMAVKKQSLLQEELKNADLMSILSGGGTTSVFKKNDLPKSEELLE